MKWLSLIVLFVLTSCGTVTQTLATGSSSSSSSSSSVSNTVEWSYSLSNVITNLASLYITNSNWVQAAINPKPITNEILNIVRGGIGRFHWLAIYDYYDIKMSRTIMSTLISNYSVMSNLYIISNYSDSNWILYNGPSVNYLSNYVTNKIDLIITFTNRSCTTNVTLTLNASNTYIVPDVMPYTEWQYRTYPF